MAIGVNPFTASIKMAEAEWIFHCVHPSPSLGDHYYRIRVKAYVPVDCEVEAVPFEGRSFRGRTMLGLKIVDIETKNPLAVETLLTEVGYKWKDERKVEEDGEA